MRLMRLLVICLVMGLPIAVGATPDAPPEKARELLKLLADPELQRWIAQQGAAAVPAGAASAATDGNLLAGQIDAMRGHKLLLEAAAPRVRPVVVDAFDKVRAEMEARGTNSMFLLVVAFIALGLGAERLFWLVSARARKTLVNSQLDTPGARLHAALARCGFGAGWVIAFALGSIGAFLAFDWPPALRDLLLRLLVAVVVIRLAMVLGHLLFAPVAPRFRLVPMDDGAARYWHRRLMLNVAWGALLMAYVGWLFALEADDGVTRLVAYCVYIGQLLLVLEAVWRRPGIRDDHFKTLNWLLTVALAVLLLLRIAGAFPLFWLGAVFLFTFGAIRLVSAIAMQLQRGPQVAPDALLVPEIGAVAVLRGMRLLLISVAGLVLALNWGIDLAALVTSNTVAVRLVRGVFSVVVIVLFADLLWFVFKAMVERRLAEAEAVGVHEAHAGNATRLRTVLPILRNVSFVTLAVITVLMALSALGVDVAPMVAGAGVVGIAVGFGAQTLVKDIVSGVFFLLDDAFRVGEYIQSGNYKGTVEAFSLRSVKLRHHRGPVYTVPFGELGAVQNMSRDWVIDKLTIGITYDSDIDKARKLIKAIGKELAADPEFAPHIIEPLKMQGVEEFGDFAIQIRMKMMTRPGEQFVIRRKANAMIKAAFDANGIRFAYPTVQVSGGAAADAGTAAAAQQMLGARKDPAAG